MIKYLLGGVFFITMTLIEAGFHDWFWAFYAYATAVACLYRWGELAADKYKLINLKKEGL